MGNMTRRTHAHTYIYVYVTVYACICIFTRCAEKYAINLLITGKASTFACRCLSLYVCMWNVYVYVCIYVHVYVCVCWGKKCRENSQ